MIVLPANDARRVASGVVYPVWIFVAPVCRDAFRTDCHCHSLLAMSVCISNGVLLICSTRTSVTPVVTSGGLYGNRGKGTAGLHSLVDIALYS